MRIGFVSYELAPEVIGGIGTYVQHATRMLQDRGHDVVIVAATRGQPSTVKADGKTVVRVPCTDRRRFSVVAAPAISAENRQCNFDVIEVPDLYAEGAGIRTLLPDIPIVLRAHTPAFVAHWVDFHALAPGMRTLSAARRLFGGFRRPATIARAWSDARRRLSWSANYQAERDPERQVAMDADLVSPPSAKLATVLAHDWHIPPEKIRLLPYVHFPSPDLLKFVPGGEGSTVAFHGGVRFFKGVHVLVAAIPSIVARHPSARFVIAGPSGSSPVPNLSWRGALRDELLTWRDTVDWLQPKVARFGRAVTFSGFISPESLPAHLGAATVCVFPSMFDNFPNACLEAMVAGRAIVATQSGGMEEMLGDNEAGLLVKPGDAQALSDAIVRLLENPGLRRELGENARNRVLRTYSPDSIGPRHEAMYQEAIAARHRAVTLTASPV